MYFPGEALNLDPTVSLWGDKQSHVESNIYMVNDASGLLARNATRSELHADMPVVDERLAEALFRLSDEYGLDFPGIGCLVVRGETPDATNIGYTYTTYHFVDGANMLNDMTQVPLDVTLGTVRKILTYYEDMSQDFSGRLYLADLSLRQCMYGRTLGEGAIDDGQSRPYFVDYDRRLSNISKILFSEPFANYGEGFGGIAGLDDDLYALKQNYPEQNFDLIAESLLGIANHQGIFYKVPTAYYHVQSLTERNT